MAIDAPGISHVSSNLGISLSNTSSASGVAVGVGTGVGSGDGPGVGDGSGRRRKRLRQSADGQGEVSRLTGGVGRHLYRVRPGIERMGYARVGCTLENSGAVAFVCVVVVACHLGSAPSRSFTQEQVGVHRGLRRDGHLCGLRKREGIVARIAARPALGVAVCCSSYRKWCRRR